MRYLIGDMVGRRSTSPGTLRLHTWPACQRPAKNAEEWIASLTGVQNKPLLSAPVCRQEEDKANKAKDINDT